MSETTEVIDLDVVDDAPYVPTPDGIEPAAPVTLDATPSNPTPDEIDEFEVCPTPIELARSICGYFRRNYASAPSNVKLGPIIIEPSCGDGLFVSAIRESWPHALITGVEIRAACANAAFAAGADVVVSSSLEAWLDTEAGRNRLALADLVIGNPPFSLAEKHVRALLAGMHPGAQIAFLLKTSFYESNIRLDFWSKYPEDSFSPIVPRPGFKLNKKGKKGTDSQAYALFVWTAGQPQGDHAVLTVPRRLPHIVWREPVVKKVRQPRKPRTPKSVPVVTGPVFDLE